jgi:hypothetical protein
VRRIPNGTIDWQQCAFDKAVVLFDEVIFIRRAPMVTSLREFASFLEFRNDRRIRWMSIGVNDSGSKMSYTPQNHLQEVLRSSPVPYGESIKPMVLPSESTARYK